MITSMESSRVSVTPVSAATIPFISKTKGTHANFTFSMRYSIGYNTPSGPPIPYRVSVSRTALLTLKLQVRQLFGTRLKHRDDYKRSLAGAAIQRCRDSMIRPPEKQAEIRTAGNVVADETRAATFNQCI